MRTRLVVLTSAFVMLLSVALAAPAAASHLLFTHIVNYNSGQCLAIGGGSMTRAAAAIQWPCTGGKIEQVWQVDSNLDLNTTIVNLNSEQCLAVGGGATWPGAGVIQWPCGGGREQLWAYNRLTNTITNVNSALCLAIGGASTAPGAKAIQWGCNGGPEQRWFYWGGGS